MNNEAVWNRHEKQQSKSNYTKSSGRYAAKQRVSANYAEPSALLAEDFVRLAADIV